ncbi:exosortase A [Pseudoblastomonas halimionae]|uniref:Exosortase A n=1 Tax=Alteriqipengyuania halimionae TaxID=1926630 RepID=A0A6I4U4S1_9SPHN|nr:exosortase A [Alteriqipengyuania halimionae]MXP09227.1 exosortase A [Alteriqipengyuania halimionae]
MNTLTARRRTIWDALPEPWRAPAIRLAAAWLALIVLFLPDWADMADQWWNASTYNHVLFVPFIAGWLVSLRLPQLRKLVPRAWWPGMILVVGAAMVWLLGAFSGLNLARQLGAVALLPASAVALLGPRVALGALFPLAYLMFLVPFGDELVPALQMITAKISIALVHASGVPAVIDGVFIETPVGLFEVAEACSGVKFLVAMVAFSAFVANLFLKSWRRRVVFVAFAIVTSIVANGIRAWGTIYIAQSQGLEFAAGFDHIVYGWVFFAVVLALVLGISWRFFDRAADDPMIDAEAIERLNLGPLERGTARPLILLATFAAMVLAAHAWASAANAQEADVANTVLLPEVPGWERVAYDPQLVWEPKAEGARHRLMGRYRNADGRTIDVFVAVYAEQTEGAEPGGYGQGALDPSTGWAYNGEGVAVPDARSEMLLGNGTAGRAAATFYRIGETLTGSRTAIKLAAMRDRLLLDPRAVTVLILSPETRDPQAGAETIKDFRVATGPIGPWLDRIAIGE